MAPPLFPIRISEKSCNPCNLWSLLLVEQDLHHLDGGLCDAGSGAEDGGDAGLVVEVVVLGGDDTAGDDHDVLTTKLLQLFDELRDECLVTGGEGRSTNDVDVVLNGLASSLGRSLEQRSHIDVEATVCISRSHYFCTTVVTVLTHLGYEDTGAATFLLGELIGQLTC